MSVPHAVRNVCKWRALPTAPGTRAAPHDVMCSNCKRVVPFLDAWTTIPYSPITEQPIGHGYVHCQMCAVALDATAAWMDAHRRYEGRTLPG